MLTNGMADEHSEGWMQVEEISIGIDDYVCSLAIELEGLLCQYGNGRPFMQGLIQDPALQLLQHCHFCRLFLIRHKKIYLLSRPD